MIDSQRGRRRPWSKLCFHECPPINLEEILDQVRSLPEEERRRLVADLQGEPGSPPSEDRRRAAMGRWLARAGTGHADVDDVSSHKNRYLAEIYATKP